MIFNVLQLLGGIILSVGYIPQIIQIIKTKSVKDLNFKMLISIFIGICLMEAYAINLVVTSGSGIMFLVTNSMSLILSFTMVALKLRYGNIKDSRKE